MTAFVRGRLFPRKDYLRPISIYPWRELGFPRVPGRAHNLKPNSSTSPICFPDLARNISRVYVATLSVIVIGRLIRQHANHNPELAIPSRDSQDTSVRVLSGADISRNLPLPPPVSLARANQLIPRTRKRTFAGPPFRLGTTSRSRGFKDTTRLTRAATHRQVAKTLARSRSHPSACILRFTRAPSP